MKGLWTWTVILGLAVVGSTTALAALSVGAKAPMMHVKAVAGHESGQKFCTTCSLAGKEGVVIFMTSSNDMMASLLKQLDEESAKHDPALPVTAVFLGQAGRSEARLKQIAQEENLKHVSLAILDKASDLPGWHLEEGKATTAYVVNGGKIADAWATAGCAHCEGFAAKIAKAVK